MSTTPPAFPAGLVPGDPVTPVTAAELIDFLSELPADTPVFYETTVTTATGFDNTLAPVRDLTYWPDEDGKYPAGVWLA